MLSASQAAGAPPDRRLRILAGAPFVPWPPTTYSNQVVSGKLGAMAVTHDVTFVCGVASETDRANLRRLEAEVGVATHGVTAPNSRGQAARVWCHAASLARGAATGLPHKLFKSGNAPLLRELADRAASGVYDLAQLDYWYVGRGWVAACPIPSVCYVHDLMFERVAREDEVRGGRRQGSTAALRARPFTRGLRRAELGTLAAFDALAAISPREADTLATLLPGKRVAPLPAGVDMTRLRAVGDPAEPLSVVFVGALASGPNEDGAWAFAQHVWPLVAAIEPRTRLYVVGSGPSARLRALDGHGGVTVTGDVPDVRAWYERCGIVVSPLRWGSGMKGKVLEAMAMGRPLVATEVSMEGIPAVDGEHYLAANGPQDFVAALARLFLEPEEGARLAAAARRLVEDHFDAAACMRAYVAFIEEVARA